MILQKLMPCEARLGTLLVVFFQCLSVLMLHNSGTLVLQHYTAPIFHNHDKWTL